MIKSRLGVLVTAGFFAVIASNVEAFNLRGALSEAAGAVKNFEKTLSGDTTPESYVSIKDTALHGLFSSPNNSETFPRVAITVLESPPFHAEMLPMGRNEQHERGCFKLSAVLWRTEKDREDVPEFLWCSHRDIAYGVPMSDVSRWGSYPLMPTSPFEKGNTGRNRTDGPGVPETAIPNDLRHQTYFGGSMYRSYNLFMIGSVLYEMGFDWTYNRDKRVWFAKFNEAFN